MSSWTAVLYLLQYVFHIWPHLVFKGKIVCSLFSTFSKIRDIIMYYFISLYKQTICCVVSRSSDGTVLQQCPLLFVKL